MISFMGRIFDKTFKILRMASGCDHLLLLDISGQVYSLGCAESGQLGRVSTVFDYSNRISNLILLYYLVVIPFLSKRWPPWC